MIVFLILYKITKSSTSRVIMISLVLTIITVSCGYSTSILPSVTKYIPTRIAL